MWRLLLNSVAISVILCWQAEGGIRREIICRLSVYPKGQNINWTCPEQKAVYVEKGWYIPKNILPSRVQILGNKAYVLTPKFSSGVPFSLGVIWMGGPCKAEPVLSPFPSWELQEPTIGGSGIINAVDVFLDRKKILWVLDIGITETLDKPQGRSPPKVLAICIQSAAVVAVVDLSPFSTSESRFHELQVEVTDDEDTYVYVSDSGSKAIIVWDYSKSTGYKVELPPEAADDGSCKDILYLTLMSTNMLYFSFMNGHKMYRTSTSNLRFLPRMPPTRRFDVYQTSVASTGHQRRGSSLGSQGYLAPPVVGQHPWRTPDALYLRCSKTLTEVEEIGTRRGKLVILGSDKKSKMFFRGKGDNQIYMWDTSTPFKPASFVPVDAPMQGMYSTHVSVGYMRLTWALSSNFPDFATGNRSSVGPFVKLHPICRATRCGAGIIGRNGGNGDTDGNCSIGGSSGNGGTGGKTGTGSNRDNCSTNGNGGTADSSDNHGNCGTGITEGTPDTKGTLDDSPTRGRGFPNSPIFKIPFPDVAERGAVVNVFPSCPQHEGKYTTHQPGLCPRCGHVH